MEFRHGAANRSQPMQARVAAEACVCETIRQSASTLQRSAHAHHVGPPVPATPPGITAPLRRFQLELPVPPFHRSRNELRTCATASANDAET